MKQFPAQRISIPVEDRERIMDRFHEVFDTGMLAYGKYVEKFEEEWARVCGTKYAVATTSCSTALEILIRSLNIPRNKRILLPTNTYIATAQACINAGYRIRLWDIEKDLNLDIEGLNSRELESVGAIVLVHIGGNLSPLIQDLVSLCRDTGIYLIEDCAHAHGVPGAGTFGSGGCFSFYPTKLITTGEGGMLVTDDIFIRDFARSYRHHGRLNTTVGYSHVDCCFLRNGSNHCMDELRAILGLSQVGRLDEYIRNRRQIAEVYKEKVSCVESENTNHYKYITYDNLVVNGQVDLSGKVYGQPLHKVEYLERHRVSGPSKWLRREEWFPRADKYCRFHKCLPIYNNQTVEEAQEILENIEVVR